MTISFLGNFNVDYSSESHHAATLEAMGHEVTRIQEGEYFHPIDTPDLFVWVHTHGWQTPNIEDLIRQMKQAKVPIISYHLDLWLGLDRQKDLETDPFYKLIDHWFVTDKLMADWLNKNTGVKGYYLPAGVFEPETEMLSKSDEHIAEVVFVGSRGYHHEWPYRPLLIDWLAETYGDNFGHYSGEQEAICLKRGWNLNQLYANTKVVVGDSLCIGFDYPYYWSDRVYETLGRGGFLIMPYIKGLDDTFEDGKHLVFYEFGDFEDLKNKINFYLQNDQAREYIRKQGHELVKKHHTYTKRWERILDEVSKS